MDHEAAIRSYYRCFQERDRFELERLLTPDFRHMSPFGLLEDRDSMLDQIWPAVGRSWATDIQIFGQGSEYLVRYPHAGEASGTMAKYVRTDGERIAEIHVFVGRS
jgi:hypothetical protein